MKKILRSVLPAFIAALVLEANAQSSAKSLLINHGASACGSTSPQQQFFSGALSAAPSQVHSCNVGLPYGGVFSAYNPVDHKVYYADINGTDTKVYVLDFNFGGALTSPSATTPTYTYSYNLNQLCFDNFGNNYGFSKFTASSGKAQLAKIDIATGTEVSGSIRSLQFPAGHIPNTVGDGDIVVLPNGRLFATFGNAPSMLYELSDPNNTGTMTVNYLTDLPRVCYSIAFVDGSLITAGADASGCYYYKWDINSATLSTASAFPAAKTSADMSNLTLAVGTTKQLTGVRSINSNTAQVYYQIVIKNKGNIFLNNIQVADDLIQTFGAGNVSNVQVSFLTNPAGLQLNPSYNGTTDVNLLLPGQSLNNYPSTGDSAIINLMVTATNLVSNKVYYNSAVASGNIGAGTTYLAVSDSSNNGGAARMDLNDNGVSDDAGENVPTPFVFTGNLLPVKGLSLQGTKTEENVKLTWQNFAAEDYVGYEVERSFNGVNFEKVGAFENDGKSTYSFSDHISSSSTGLFYQIKGLKTDNTVAFSNTVYIKNGASLGLSAYPNPFHTSVSIQLQTSAKGIANIAIRDITGRTVATKNIAVEKGGNYLTLTELQNAQPGAYLIEVSCGGERSFVKVMKQ